MREHRILVSNPEVLSKDTVHLFETFGDECWGMEVGEQPTKFLNLLYTKAEIHGEHHVELYGKSPGQHITNVLPNFFEIVANAIDRSKFCGHILMVSMELKHFERRSSWLEELPASSEYFAVNRAKEYLKHLREFKPRYPIVVAIYNHNIPNAMSTVQLKHELEIDDGEPIVPIDLMDKSTVTQAIDILIKMRDS